MINKIDKPLARLIKKKRRGFKSIKSEMKKGTTDTAEIQRILKDYYKKLYANKMDNLEEMDRCLQRYNLPSLNQEETENMNQSQVTKLNILLKTFQKTKVQDQVTSQVNSAKHLEKSYHILLKFLKN